MRIGEAPSVRKPIPLTPLIDVVFLLLMFFMLSSTFTKFGTLDTGAAGAGGTVSVAGKRFPGAIIVVAGPGKMLINGTAVEPAQLVASLDRLFADGVTLVALRAVKSANVQDLVAVLDLARQSRITEIVVMP